MIRLLPQNLINQIAAGEVIERPASTIKELVENALDAYATHIEVTIRDGGRTFMMIRDNGCGMRQQELPLAVQRHATSKLSTNDLFNIKTMGFRGEALPSIGAISRLKITSKHRDDQDAWQICIEGGQVSELSPAAHPQGTTVEVSDLFFATPARLKFLKTATTETAYIVEVLQRLAMAYPHVGFILKDERRTIFDYKGDVSLMEGMGQLSRLQEILGKDFAENALPIEAEHSHYKLTGYVSLATLNRSSASYQYFCVNGRPVKDKVFSGAVRVAYQDFLARDRYPMVALFLTMDPLYVDMNVHPAKTEVRFRDSGHVRGLILGAIKAALNEAGHRSSTTVSQQALGAFIPQMMPKSSYAYRESYQAPSMARQPLPLQEATHVSYQGMMVPQLKVESVEALQPIPKDHVEESFPLGIAKAQIHDTYIVAEAEDGLVIVDQHAAHERLVYERMKIRMATQPLPRQALLVPEVVELAEHQIEELMKRAPELELFGLVIEVFGPRAILVRETPAILGSMNVQQLVLDLVDEIETIGEAVALKERVETVCGTLACHSSIRAGRQLSLDEMNELLRQMEQTPHSGQCNHGRPTYVALKKSDIEKLFGRR